MTDAAKEARRAYKRRWAKEHPDRVRAHQEKYYEKLAAAEAAGTAVPDSVSRCAQIHRKGVTRVDQCAHMIMETPIDATWHGSTVVDDYQAFYHEERLYSVLYLKTGICCLVYASSPYDAIEKVRSMGASV